MDIHVYMYVILLSCLWIVDVTAYVPFTLTDCGSSSNRVVNVRGHIVEYPLEFPGHVKVQASGDILKDIGPNRYIMDVTVEKWIVFSYFALPCISNVGSCSYDMCELLGKFEGQFDSQDGCPPQLTESNFPCMCPFTNGTYTLDPRPFYVPEVQSVWQWIAFGDFRVTGTLYDTELSEIVNCYSVEFTVQRKPTISVDFWRWW